MALQPALVQLAEGMDNVLLLDPCRPEEIIEKAAEGDMGVIPFLPTCLNHYLNTPNKLFQICWPGCPSRPPTCPT